jgi:hypothetical protein
MEQRVEALRRTEHFREKRISKFVEWLEKILVRNPDGEEYLVGMAISCADLWRLWAASERARLISPPGRSVDRASMAVAGGKGVSLRASRPRK